MSTEDRRTVAQIAADWWCEKYGPGSSKDAGFEPAYRAALGPLLEREAAKKMTAEDAAKVEVFRIVLESMINTRLKTVPGVAVYLENDFCPFGTLANAADAAGLKDRWFPWKTSMVVRADSVTVQEGYCGEVTTVFNAGGDQEKPQNHQPRTTPKG